MDSVVISDLHGNWIALYRLLHKIGALRCDIDTALEDPIDSIKCIRKDDFRYVFVGDVCNMMFQTYNPPTHSDLITLQIVNEIANTICVGNHEVYFTHNLDTGRFIGMASSPMDLEPGLLEFLGRMVRNDRFVAATTVWGDNKWWLVTHAGLHPLYMEAIGISDKEDSDNETFRAARELNHGFKKRYTRTLDYFGPIDNVGQASGGRAHVGGIFWLRPSEWKNKYKSIIPQIVGHTPDKKNPRFVEVRNTYYIDNGSAACILSDGGPWEAFSAD